MAFTRLLTVLSYGQCKEKNKILAQVFPAEYDQGNL